MKNIYYSLLMIYLISSQGLELLKSNISNSFGFSNVHISQSLETITSSFAAGLSNVNAEMGLHLSYMNYDAIKSSMRFNGGLSYKLNDDHFLSLYYKQKSISDYEVNSKLNRILKLGQLSDNTITFGYGYRINDNSGIGLNSSYIRSEIVPLEHRYNGETIRVVSLITFGLSGYLSIDRENETSIVASIQNIGGEKAYSIDTDPIKSPMFYHFGVSSIFHRDRTYYLYGTSNFARDKDGNTRFDVGAGVQLNYQFDFHLNYISDSEFDINDNYLSFGVGYGKKEYKLNAKFEAYDDSRTILKTGSQMSISIDYYLDVTEHEISMEEELIEFLNEEEEKEEIKPVVVQEEVKEKVILEPEPIKVDSAIVIVEKTVEEVKPEPKEVVIKRSPDMEKLIENATERRKKGILLKTYIVKDGDSFWKISKKHLGRGSKFLEYVDLNIGRFENRDLLHIGQELVIIDQYPQNVDEFTEVYYFVEEGETLLDISRKLYNDASHWSDIADWNKSIIEKSETAPLQSIYIRIVLN